MSALMIRCPYTKQLVPVGIDIDAESFRNGDFRDNVIQCSACNLHHKWSKEDAILS